VFEFDGLATWLRLSAVISDVARLGAYVAARPVDSSPHL
jgi:hypothetical protein